MGKFIKQGKVVILTNGRFAGKKAIVVKSFDEGTKERAFPHALVAGLERSPLRVVRSQSQKKILKRSKVKPFLKHINYNHIMPTRYTVMDIDLKAAINPTTVKQQSARVDAKKEIKKLFEKRYLTRGKNSNGVQYFFHRLRF